MFRANSGDPKTILSLKHPGIQRKIATSVLLAKLATFCFRSSYLDLYYEAYAITLISWTVQSAKKFSLNYAAVFFSALRATIHLFLKLSEQPYLICSGILVFRKDMLRNMFC